MVGYYSLVVVKVLTSDHAVLAYQLSEEVKLGDSSDV